ncbi:WD40-repeat-containing domain protein [Flammula alnicola]|nr:WD40-repeat-containing domain protein [Flammula alnicola]
MPSTKNPKFVLKKELKGSKGPVNVLVFSQDAKLLLSGGLLGDDEKVRIWNTETLDCSQVLENEKWGQITALIWVIRDSPTMESTVSLCVGSARGTVTLYPMSQGNKHFASKDAVTLSIFGFNDSIEAQAYDRVNSRLVLGSHSGEIKVFNVDKLSLKVLWTVNINAIPRALFFFGGANQSLLTLGLESGELTCWEAQKPNILWKKKLAGAIGNAALSTDENTLLVDNVSSHRFDVYTIPSATPLQSLSMTSTRHFIKQCQFLDGTKMALCGSDTNKMHIIEVTTNECIQTLVSGKEADMTQTVAVKAVANKTFVAGGASNGSIYFWEKVVNEDTLPEEKPGPAQHQSLGWFYYTQILLVIVLTYANWSPHVFDFVAFIAQKWSDFYSRL